MGSGGSLPAMATRSSSPPCEGVWRTVGYEEVGVIWMISVHGLSF